MLHGRLEYFTCQWASRKPTMAGRGQPTPLVHRNLGDLTSVKINLTGAVYIGDVSGHWVASTKGKLPEKARTMKM